MWVTNNLWEDMGYSNFVYGFGPTSMRDLWGINTSPVLSGAPSDSSASSTGSWVPDSLVFKNNTIVKPTDGYTNNRNGRFFVFNFGGLPANAPYTWYKPTNFVVTDNIVAMSTTYAFQNSPASFGVDGTGGGSTSAQGTTALDLVTDPTTRSVTKNCFYYPSVSTTAESNSLTASTDTSNLFYTDETSILFTSHTYGTISNYALQAGSPCHNVGTTGGDIGVDTVALEAAVSGVKP
jgi:hypothetical protein